MSVSSVECVRGEGAFRLECRARLVDADGDLLDAAPVRNDDEWGA